MKSKHREIEKAIGYRFKKKALLELALIHPSYRYENPKSGGDNQRLEYLGDAALSLVCAEYLFNTHPCAQEGDMSKLRSRLTQDRTLAEIGVAIGIGSDLRMGRGEAKNGGAERGSNLADAVEAIIGAAWIDGGSRAVNRIFRKIFVPELEELDPAAVDSNPKGDLQEYVQRMGHDIPIYETVDTAGPEHDRTFTVEVHASGQTWKASAGSKREAERMAAQQAMEQLQDNAPS